MMLKTTTLKAHRFWHQQSRLTRKRRQARPIFGLAILMGAGGVVMASLGPVLNQAWAAPTSLQHVSDEIPTPLGITAADLGPSDPDAPLTDVEMAAHVLDRLAFGGTQADLQRVLDMGWRVWVEEQLEPMSIDDVPVDQWLNANASSLTMSMSEVFRTYRPPYEDGRSRQEQTQERNRLRRDVQQQLQESVLYRAVYSNRRFQEVMAEFWRNHFNVDQAKDDVAYLANHYEQDVVRRYSFDQFGKMLLKSGRHPAMLVYLDNIVSQKPLHPSQQELLERYGDREDVGRSIRALRRHRGLNENYARELMELHSLGVDRGYTQRDVTETARVLTGWTAGWVLPNGRLANQENREAEYGFYFRSNVHDTLPKRILGASMRGSGGEADGINLIVSLSNHRFTAEHVSFKLCQYLVNDNPPDHLVNEVARVFRRHNGDLTEVYRAIIFHPEFRARRNYRAKFKTPFEFVVSTLRTVSAETTNWRPVVNAARLMGQSLYRCEDPTGYEDQFEAWLDPGVLVYRWDFTLDLMDGEHRGTNHSMLWESLNMEPDQRVDAAEVQRIIQRLCPAGVGGRTRALIEEAAANGARARRVAALVLGSPSFQQQ